MIVFISNYLNHHQLGVAEELFTQTGGQYKFVETIKVPDFRKKMGYLDYSNREYVIKAWEDNQQYTFALKLCMEADVVVFGGNRLAFNMVKPRIKAGKLAFEMSERWLKRGLINLTSPNLINETITYWLGNWKKKPVYRLCMSAYAANDLYFLQQYKDKCYKWGYFTAVDNKKRDKSQQNASTREIRTTIMWCARFLRLKHPELPVILAERLKKRGYDFVIDMFGDGEKKDYVRSLIEKLNVGDVVKLYGNKPNSEILNEMRAHDLFLFTSDRHEGWGAVLNEAMSNGCVPIAADEIGSVPFLINNGENGFIFKSKDIVSLENRVIGLIENPKRMSQMSENARKTMQLWSPKVAAQRLLQLIESIKEGAGTPFGYGPCSKAEPIS